MFRDVVSHADTGSSIQNYSLTVSDRKISFGYDNGSGRGWDSQADIFTAGTWTHVCGVRIDNLNIVMYADGAAVPADLVYSTGSTIPTALNPIAIGRRGGFNGGYLNGQIDDVRIYDRAITAGEVSQLYNSGSGCP